MQFPLLKSGAATQYPLSAGVLRQCVVLPYLDGSEQVLAVAARPEQSWLVTYTNLSEGEAAALRNFIEAVGPTGIFEFVDPFTDILHTDCFLESYEFEEVYDERSAVRASLISLRR